MRRISWYLLLITVLALGVVLSACAYPVPAPAGAEEANAAEDVEAVTAAINEIWDQYASSLNAGDVDRYMALWADEAMQLPPGSPPVVGKETLRAGLESEVDSVTFDMKINNEEVHVAGDLAVARGTYMATVTPKDGSEEIFIDGKYMTLLKRQPDGSWKIYPDIYNSNVPPVEQAEPQAAVDVEAVTAAVNAIWNHYTAGANTGDLDLWLSLWDDNGVRLAPDTPAVYGKEQIRAQMQVPFDQFNNKIAIKNEEVEVAGDWAFSRGTYTLSTTPKAGGDEIFIDGKYMTILKRQPDGSWKIYRDIFNSNVPPPQE
jgi:uncharacterized protein (TIGR02246 family)